MTLTDSSETAARDRTTSRVAILGLAGVLGLASPSAFSASILYDASVSHQSQLIETLPPRLPAPQAGHDWQALPLSANSSQGVNSTTLSLGLQSTRQALGEPRIRHLFSALINQSQYHRVQPLVPRSLGRWDVLVTDPPAAQIVQLLRLLLPDSRKVGVLYSPASAAQMTQLAQAFDDAIELTAKQVLPGQNLSVVLGQLLPEVEVLVALADERLYNANTAYAVLLSAYRAGVPVVAMSHAFVQAGALAGLYPHPGSLEAQIGRWMEDVLSNRSRGDPVAHMAHFAVSINHQVARTLGIHLREASWYTQQIHGAQP